MFVLDALLLAVGITCALPASIVTVKNEFIFRNCSLFDSLWFLLQLLDINQLFKVVFRARQQLLAMLHLTVDDVVVEELQISTTVATLASLMGAGFIRKVYGMVAMRSQFHVPATQLFVDALGSGISLLLSSPR